MKRTLYVALLLALTGCLSSNQRQGDIPAFNLLMPDSVTIFNTGKIQEGKPVAFLFFSPDCEHCQEETADILQKIDSLKNIQFYFITVDPMDRIRVFNHYYKISTFPNITLGKDISFFFPTHFKTVNAPYLVIYDQYKKERGVFKGEFAASQIIAFINTL